jgi:hypothetical protein
MGMKHDREKWTPVFPKNRAQTKESSADEQEKQHGPDDDFSGAFRSEPGRSLARRYPSGNFVFRGWRTGRRERKKLARNAGRDVQ